MMELWTRIKDAPFRIVQDAQINFGCIGITTLISLPASYMLEMNLAPTAAFILLATTINVFVMGSLKQYSTNTNAIPSRSFLESSSPFVISGVITALFLSYGCGLPFRLHQILKLMLLVILTEACYDKITRKV